MELSGAAMIEHVTQQTHLFLPLPMQAHQLPIVYDRAYNISFMGMEKLHAFDAGKWGKVFDFISTAGVVKNYDTVLHPEEATRNDLQIVHTKRYIDSLKNSPTVAQVVEVAPVVMVPNAVVQRVLLSPLRRQTGGTILAAKLALLHGWAINLGGGFHHCSSDRGAGFCAYADITLAIRFLQLRREIRRGVMIIDLDAHQGNGHARDFMNNKDFVYILDAFNPDIYPHDTIAMSGISQRIHVKSRIHDAEYLAAVDAGIRKALDDEFPQPDLIVYNAGTDILEGDRLGNMNITPRGIVQRDEMVFEHARSRRIPIVMVLSGGYQQVTSRVIADSIINLNVKGLLKLNDDAATAAHLTRRKSEL